MTEFDDFNVPVCRFGPGGDYVNDWPVKKNQPPVPESNPLGKVLALIADVMGTAISGELMIQAQDKPYVGTGGKVKQIQVDTQKPNNSKLTKEKSDPTDEPDHTNYTTTTAGAKDSCPVTKEPMLFTDDCRGSRGAKRKPHHRIRAYRRTGRKRPARKIQGQASLFEVDAQSQSAA